jgi:hypothetical protein
MKSMEKEAPPRGITTRQRRRVERNLPLVKLALRKHRKLMRPDRTGREAGELMQEGCLALVEAVRTHDRRQHGEFASFAMARIHYAISRFAREQGDLIRVPFITQRRHKRRHSDGGDGGESDRHRPDAPPRVVRLHRARAMARRGPADGGCSERSGGGGGEGTSVTVGELIRERYDRAVEQVAARLKKSHHAAPGLGELVNRCFHERWTVPEPDAQTPLRQMAKELGCSLGRITHCEDRFRIRLMARLFKDKAWARLMAIARRREAGMSHRLSEEELAEVGGKERAGDSSEPAA